MPPKKRRIFEESEGEEADDHDGAAEIGFLHGPHEFKPLYLIYSWEEPKIKTKRVAVAILLPSGIEKRDWSLRFQENARALDFTVPWPLALLDLDRMHKTWLPQQTGYGHGTFQKFYPCYLSFETALRGMRDRQTDGIGSTARISLPFQVESHIENTYNLA